MQLRKPVVKQIHVKWQMGDRINPKFKKIYYLKSKSKKITRNKTKK